MVVRMKKRVLALMLAGVMTVSVCACGNKNTTDSEGTTQTEATTESVVENTEPSLLDEERVSAREDYVALADVETADYLELPDYKNMVVEVDKVAVTDDSILGYINSNVLTSYPVTDRAVANGDVALIDYVGKKDGVAFDGGTAQGYQLEIGSGTFIPGFEDGLVGVMPGTTVDLDITFPEDYAAADLAGQAVVFTVTVHSIQEKTDYDAITLEQMAAIGLTYESKEALWEEAKKVVEENAEASYQMSIENAIIENLMTNTTVTSIPEYLVEEEVQNYFIYQQNICNSIYGCDLETFVNGVYGMTMSDYTTQMMAMSEETVKQYMIMEAIARAEGIEVTDADVQAKAEEEAVAYMFDSAEDLLTQVGESTYRMYIVQDEVMQKLKPMVTVNPMTTE